MPLSRDFKEFVECLNSNKVEYLIVGALAVSWHGFPRHSGDMDFLIRPLHNTRYGKESCGEKTAMSHSKMVLKVSAQ